LIKSQVVQSIIGLAKKQRGQIMEDKSADSSRNHKYPSRWNNSNRSRIKLGGIEKWQKKRANKKRTARITMPAAGWKSRRTSRAGPLRVKAEKARMSLLSLG
jgi:hypothetical protein